MRIARPADPWDPAHPPHAAQTPDSPADTDVAAPAHSPSSKPIPIHGIRPRI